MEQVAVTTERLMNMLFNDVRKVQLERTDIARQNIRNQTKMFCIYNYRLHSRSKLKGKIDNDHLYQRFAHIREIF
jgi:hypothetical protein